ncbi:hypothetical protein [Haloarcula onubensis]|uniref:hypothetical protein n=1 Tax=Haloarcula onubensis TaxID=2950539 RepID=UPI003AB0BA15
MDESASRRGFLGALAATAAGATAGCVTAAGGRAGQQTTGTPADGSAPSDRAWIGRHGLSSSQYQQRFDECSADGYRLTDVSGYGRNGRPITLPSGSGRIDGSTRVDVAGPDGDDHFLAPHPRLTPYRLEMGPPSTSEPESNTRPGSPESGSNLPPAPASWNGPGAGCRRVRRRLSTRAVGP